MTYAKQGINGLGLTWLISFSTMTPKLKISTDGRARDPLISGGRYFLVPTTPAIPIVGLPETVTTIWIATELMIRTCNPFIWIFIKVARKSEVDQYAACARSLRSHENIARFDIAVNLDSIEIVVSELANLELL